eukprot:10396840-Karenia_brevis.AAC.1
MDQFVATEGPSGSTGETGGEESGRGRSQSPSRSRSRSQQSSRRRSSNRPREVRTDGEYWNRANRPKPEAYQVALAMTPKLSSPPPK